MSGGPFPSAGPGRDVFFHSSGSGSTMSGSGGYGDDTQIGSAVGAEISPQEFAKNVVILLLSTVALLVGLIVSAYAISLLCRRFCRCCSFLSPIHAAEDEGEVAREAGLAGLTLKERRAVLERALVGKPYHKDTHCEPGSTGSNEMDDPKSSGEKTENGEDEGMTVEMREVDFKSEEGHSQIGSLSDEVSPTADMESGGCSESEDETKKAESSLGEENAQQIKNDSAVTCAICITEYEENDVVVYGASCSHMFHLDCVLEWLEHHDCCPWCRKDMITSAQMREAASEVVCKKSTLSLDLRRNSFRFSEGGGDTRPSDQTPDLELGHGSDVFDNDGSDATTGSNGMP